MQLDSFHLSPTHLAGVEQLAQELLNGVFLAMIWCNVWHSCQVCAWRRSTGRCEVETTFQIGAEAPANAQPFQRSLNRDRQRQGITLLSTTMLYVETFTSSASTHTS